MKRFIRDTVPVVGFEEGVCEGMSDEGLIVGVELGSTDGDFVGSEEGVAVGVVEVGPEDGIFEGKAEGSTEGEMVGKTELGEVDGLRVRGSQTNSYVTQ